MLFLSSMIYLRAVSDLLLSDMNNMIYSIKNPSHPFVIILRNLNEKLVYLNRCIYEEIEYIHQRKK